MTDPSPASAVETILRSWLDERELTLFCGDWGQGGIMEILPRGGALLSGRRYDPPFEGLRDLRLDDAGHHVHLDLGRLTTVRYSVSPSVCYRFRPSFELRFGADDGPSPGFALGLGISSPYAGRTLRTAAVRRYLHRADEHLRRFPGVVRFACEAQPIADQTLPVWDEVARLLGEFGALSEGPLKGLRSALERHSRLAPAAA